MIGRTLLQQAEPTTFGREAAGWLNLLRGARRRLASVEASLPVQLGGPVGTLRGYGDQAGQIVAAVAARLDLRAAPSWHTSRLPIADLAGALATVCGAVAKVSTDIILLAQREVGEVRETTPGRGGSSSMPHKHNPIAAISARASALRGPALAGHLFACMAQEHERAAGAWHAEWLAVVDLLRAGGSAAAWLTECLGGLEVEAERMAANAAAVDVPLDQRAINVIIAELTRDEQLPGRRCRMSACRLFAVEDGQPGGETVVFAGSLGSTHAMWEPRSSLPWPTGSGWSVRRQGTAGHRSRPGPTASTTWPTTCSACSTGSASSRRTSSGSRWAG